MANENPAGAGKINDTRVILGGIAGGIAAYAADFVLNGVVFKNSWENLIARGWSKGASVQTLLPEFALVVAVSLFGTYFYALARPRLGGSAKSALRVSALIGFLSALTSGVSAMIWMRLNPAAGWALTASSFAVPAVGTFVGAWVYKE